MATRQQYEAFFRAADVNKCGTLSVDEFINAVQCRDSSHSETKLKQYFKSFDTSADQRVTMREFLSVMGFLPMEREDYMRQVFNSFDYNGDGTVSKEELKKALNKLDMPGKELDRMMAMADTSNDGKIDYEEFIRKVFKKF